MQLTRILKGLLVTLSLIFLIFQVMNLEFQATCVRVSLIVMLTILYYLKVDPRRLFFFLFLICFSLAEIVGLISFFVEIDYDSQPDYFYYLGNGLYILSYIFLIARILNDMQIQIVLKKFWIHSIILIVLDVFCVVILTGTTEKLLSKHEFSLEFTYNTIIMTLLTVSMIDYISKNSQKSMNLLLGAIFIFFSEVIQMTYFYISSIHILNVVCSLFLVVAFVFFYIQARIPVETEQNAIQENLRA